MSCRLIFVVICALLALLSAASDVGKMLASTSNGLDRLGLLFSVMAGALMTVMSVIGVSQQSGQGRRQKWRVGKNVRQHLVFLAVLFCLYILVLGLILSYEAVECSKKVAVWASRVLGFFATFAFSLSFMLPFILLSFKTKEMNEGVENRTSD